MQNKVLVILCIACMSCFGCKNTVMWQLIPHMYPSDKAPSFTVVKPQTTNKIIKIMVENKHFCYFSELFLYRASHHGCLTAWGCLVQITARAFLCGVCTFSMCMRGFLSGSAGFLPPLIIMHVRLIGDSKLSVGVHVICMVVCLCDGLATCPAFPPPLAQWQLGWAPTLNWIRQGI